MIGEGRDWLMDFETQRAFTLMELLIGLAIAVIAVGMAAPSMAELYRKHQLSGYQDDLMRLIIQARQHALINGSRVTVCALDAQNRCVSLKSGVLSGFQDSNGNRMLDDGELPLYTLPIPSHMRVNWAGMSPNHSLHFSAQGTTYLSNGTFTLCHRAELSRHVFLKISRQGRPRVEKQDGHCPLE